MATFLTAQLQPFALSGAGAIIGATSLTLKSFKTIDGVNLALADFGTIGYGTLQPGEGTLEEQISFSGVVQNANGTATLSGIKTVLNTSPYTETSGLAKTHAGSTSFVISNTSGFYNQFPAKINNETISGQWTFLNTPIVPGTVSDASTTVKGVSFMSVAPASATGPISVGSNDPRVPVAYAVDSVGTDAYAITPSPAITAYAAGQMFTFKAGVANTGAATLNVSGLGAKSIVKNTSVALATGDILLNQVIEVVYDGTNMQIVSKTGSVTPVTNVYTSSTSWTKPSGLAYVVVEVQAAGGGSGALDTDSTQGSASGGGGGGGYSRKTIAAATLGSSETVTVGVGGTAGATGGGTPTSGGTGGSSAFGTHATATGGAGSLFAPDSGASAGGAGGIGSSGDLNIKGGGGQNGVDSNDDTTSGGLGGSSHLGGGGIGGIGNGQVGAVGGVYGGGAGGSCDNIGGQIGAVGGAGVVIVTEYYN